MPRPPTQEIPPFSQTLFHDREVGMVEVATARTTEAAVVEAEEVEALASLAPLVSVFACPSAAILAPALQPPAAILAPALRPCASALLSSAACASQSCSLTSVWFNRNFVPAPELCGGSPLHVKLDHHFISDGSSPLVPAHAKQGVLLKLYGLACHGPRGDITAACI